MPISPTDVDASRRRYPWGRRCPHSRIGRRLRNSSAGLCRTANPKKTPSLRTLGTGPSELAN
jgi:hypothetical protein